MSQNQDPIHLARQFEIIFTTHYSAVKYFAINLLKSEEDAEDIIQDVFAKLWTTGGLAGKQRHRPVYLRHD